MNMPIETLVASWTGDYEVRGKLQDADCVLGLSFGYRGKGTGVTPGLSNQDLANVALKHFADLPKILQFEIADAYTESVHNNGGVVERINHHRKKNKYLDTREVVDQARLIMGKHGWKHPVLLAHPNHMPRVQLACDRLGIDWIATDHLKGAIEFDPLSTQKWTRDIDQWRGYEPLAMAFYSLKGWV